MLITENKVLRNLQEQVAKNKSDISDILEAKAVIAEFGIRVVGEVDTEAELPDPSTYSGEYGDAYTVGIQAPYDYYIFTRPNDDIPQAHWFNVGEFPMPGPQGEPGLPGAKGDKGSMIYTEKFNPTLVTGYNVGDLWINTKDNALFQLNNNGWDRVGYVKGDTGPQGPKGDKGDTGAPGTPLNIVGVLSTVDLLPQPSTVNKSTAYLIGTSAPYTIYVIVGNINDTSTWAWQQLAIGGTNVTVNNQPVGTFNADSKLDKKTTTSDYNRAYIVKQDGSQTLLNCGSNAGAYTIVSRDGNSQIIVPETPTATNHAASKKYVDSRVNGEPVNLGYYDTITENSDGTYTITKQTGYIKGTDFLNWGMNGAGNRYVIFEQIKVNNNIENIIGNCGRVDCYSWWQNTFSQVTITYDSNSDFLIILLPYGTAENDSSPLNDIHVQYKLSSARIEIVEKNYLAQYNKRFILEQNKIEAEKSSNLWSYEQSITINAGSEKWWTLSNATMDAWGLVVGETYSIKSFVNNTTKDLAFQLLPGYSDFRDGRTFVFTSDTQIRIGGNTVASTVTFTPKIMIVKGIDIADEYQPYSGAPIHKKEFEDFKNSMKFIPYVSVVETTNSQDISENGTYFVVPTDLSSASLELQVKAGPHGTLQTAYFSGGIISVFSFYDSKLQTCGVQITYGAGSSRNSIQIADSYNPAGSSSDVISRVIGKCKIYKL